MGFIAIRLIVCACGPRLLVEVFPLSVPEFASFETGPRLLRGECRVGYRSEGIPPKLSSIFSAISARKASLHDDGPLENHKVERVLRLPRKDSRRR